MNLNQYLKMFLDNVGICNLNLDAFIVSNITNADCIPLKVGKIKSENTVLNIPSNANKNYMSIPVFILI